MKKSTVTKLRKIADGNKLNWDNAAGLKGTLPWGLGGLAAGWLVAKLLGSKNPLLWGLLVGAGSAGYKAYRNGWFKPTTSNNNSSTTNPSGAKPTTPTTSNNGSSDSPGGAKPTTTPTPKPTIMTPTTSNNSSSVSSNVAKPRYTRYKASNGTVVVPLDMDRPIDDFNQTTRWYFPGAEDPWTIQQIADDVGISVDDLNYLNGGMFTDRDPNSAVRATMRSNEGKYKGRLGTPVTVPDIDKYGKLQAIKDE